MKQFIHLLKHDYMLLHRNKIITISILVTAIYVAVFKGLTAFGDVEKLLILVIFNDPALLGFLFVGVMVLFESNENTLEALAVSPLKLNNYILSKAVSLTTVSLVCCFAMAFAAHGMHFHYLHFALATILTTIIFTFLGFVAVAGQKVFNKYILKAIGIILFLSLPFLGYFEVTPANYYILFPTQPAIELFSLAFSENDGLMEVFTAYGFALVWCFVSYKWALKTITKSFVK